MFTWRAAQEYFRRLPTRNPPPPPPVWEYPQGGGIFVLTTERGLSFFRPRKRIKNDGIRNRERALYNNSNILSRKFISWSP